MNTLLPDLASVHVRETQSELVLEVEVPADAEMPHLAARVRDGRLTITLPRTPHRSHLPGFHPEATPV